MFPSASTSPHSLLSHPHLLSSRHSPSVLVPLPGRDSYSLRGWVRHPALPPRPHLLLQVLPRRRHHPSSADTSTLPHSLRGVALSPPPPPMHVHRWDASVSPSCRPESCFTASVEGGGARVRAVAFWPGGEHGEDGEWVAHVEVHVKERGWVVLGGGERRVRSGARAEFRAASTRAERVDAVRIICDACLRDTCAAWWGWHGLEVLEEGVGGGVVEEGEFGGFGVLVDGAGCTVVGGDGGVWDGTCERAWERDGWTWVQVDVRTIRDRPAGDAGGERRGEETAVSVRWGSAGSAGGVVDGARVWGSVGSEGAWLQWGGHWRGKLRCLEDGDSWHALDGVLLQNWSLRESGGDGEVGVWEVEEEEEDGAERRRGEEGVWREVSEMREKKTGVWSYFDSFRSFLRNVHYSPPPTHTSTTAHTTHTARSTYAPLSLPGKGSLKEATKEGTKKEATCVVVHDCGPTVYCEGDRFGPNDGTRDGRHDGGHEVTTASPLPYRFSAWASVDAFVYFSHHRVSVPPPGWVHAAHVHGVAALGTVAVEWRGVGRREAETLLHPVSGERVALALAELCAQRRVDGWLVNVEVGLESAANAQRLADWVRRLRAALAARLEGGGGGGVGGRGIVLWYDAVTADGALAWQSDVNDRNRIFARAAGAIMTDYHWPLRDGGGGERGERGVGGAGVGDGGLAGEGGDGGVAKEVQKTDSASPHSLHAPPDSRSTPPEEPFVCLWGVDVWGRGVGHGGGWKTWESVEAALQRCEEGCGDGVALFAPAWTLEKVPASSMDQVRANEERLWGGGELEDCERGGTSSARGMGAEGGVSGAERRDGEEREGSASEGPLTTHHSAHHHPALPALVLGWGMAGWEWEGEWEATEDGARRGSWKWSHGRITIPTLPPTCTLLRLTVPYRKRADVAHSSYSVSLNGHTVAGTCTSSTWAELVVDAPAPQHHAPPHHTHSAAITLSSKDTVHWAGCFGTEFLPPTLHVLTASGPHATTLPPTHPHTLRSLLPPRARRRVQTPLRTCFCDGAGDDGWWERGERTADRPRCWEDAGAVTLLPETPDAVVRARHGVWRGSAAAVVVDGAAARLWRIAPALGGHQRRWTLVWRGAGRVGVFVVVLDDVFTAHSPEEWHEGRDLGRGWREAAGAIPGTEGVLVVRRRDADPGAPFVLGELAIVDEE